MLDESDCESESVAYERDDATPRLVCSSHTQDAENKLKRPDEISEATRFEDRGAKPTEPTADEVAEDHVDFNYGVYIEEWKLDDLREIRERYEALTAFAEKNVLVKRIFHAIIKRANERKARLE